MLDRILIGSSAEPSDPNFKNVTLLLHGDGSNGAQNNTFIDSSTNNFTITRNGNTTQGSFSPYGSNWSNYFDGSGDYLTAPNNTAFDQNTSFTVEMWVYSTASNTDKYLYSQATNNFLQIGTNSSGKVVIDKSAVGVQVTSLNALPQNQWTHIVMMSNGSLVYLFIDGVSQGSISVGTTATSATTVAIGAYQSGGSLAFNGYISNFRVVKGTAVYSTSGFTPPTAPLTAITNTSLLTCAYNRFRDGSTNNFTITRNGDVNVNTFSPFAPSSAYNTTTNGGSAYFDGNGDYLSLSNKVSFGTGDFTVEAWVYRTVDSSIYDGIFSIEGTAGDWNSGATGLVVSCGSLHVTGPGQVTYSSSVPVARWTHVACTRSGTSLKAFINGSEVASTTASGSLGTSSGKFPLIGAFDTLSGVRFPISGYISSLRTVTGTALYTSNFTPPTTPLTAISGTSLLLNATNAAIFDNSMKNDLETVGNAQISTSVKKFGTGSIAFDGNGDYLQSPSTQDLDLGSGDFTIELWINVPSVSSQQGIIVKRNTETTGSGTWGLRINSGGSLYFEDITNSTGIVTFGTLSTNTWTHVAVTRSGSTVRGFLNGSLISSGTSTRDFTNSFALNIGFWGTASGAIQNALNGYIDDLRITKGVARYTASFTAPTAPFPNK